MARKWLIWDLFPSYLLITLVSLLAVTRYASRSRRQVYLAETAGDLETGSPVETHIRGKFAAPGDRPIDKLCKELGRLTDTRFTVILPSGAVVGDTDETRPAWRITGTARRFRLPCRVASGYPPGLASPWATI